MGYIADRLRGSGVVARLVVYKFAMRWREGERPTVEEFEEVK
jgi:hypothetical protein